MLKKHRRFRVVAVLTAALVGSLLAPFTPIAPAGEAQAITGSDFNAGYIISDEMFFKSDAMTEAQVQSFLVSRVPSCVGANGQPCLRDYRATTYTRAAVEPGHCSSYIGEANESAARIIVKAARACGINPQVLIVMLQKEQGLVTATSPTERQYRVAMGYGCPDTAACDTKYYGFYNQVYNAAWQLRQYTNYPQRAYRIGVVNIAYNPNAACGSSAVNIRNQATANLYNYTPYQPNAAALANLRGIGDGCSAYGNRNFWVTFHDWFGDPTGANVNPIGNVELIATQPGSFRVVGWALDPDSSAPISIHVYVGTVGTAYGAELTRNDVGAAYPGLGSQHGFDVNVPAQGADQRRVCVYAMNVGPGAPVLLSCVDTEPLSGPPVGSEPSITTTATTVEVSGWALDPDITGAIPVHVYVGSVGTAITASKAATIPSKYAAYGPNHGYAASLPTSPGEYRVCVYGINSGPGGHALFACRDVVVGNPPFPDLGRAPIGNVELVRAGVGSVELSGWALDPDTTASIQVHAYVDSVGVAFAADKERADVARIYPRNGSAHGFATTIKAEPGQRRVCLYAINTGAGGHTLLSCTTLVIPAAPPAPDLGRVPIGNVEVLEPVAGGVAVGGWALDPDTDQPIQVHVYVDTVGTALRADLERPDVARAYPANGPYHGFEAVIPASTGAHRVCVYGINTGPGGHVQFRCADIVVP
ncbi:hypothetical protein J7E25_14545 [Agromyces sp. ISL-38]|uniref:hypothetical protein n=1 Tax=Agromyces sp. ISL-38 TaxID=2819107 RepID=UPI001BE68F0A|nr:hypothetical protein [Agromyces sp. ISL-38]MBT2500311.1 hypothetical protein [Agromyces sp. ISL-38]